MGKSLIAIVYRTSLAQTLMTPSTSILYVPYPKDWRFVRRDTLMNSLWQCLQDETTASAALCGLSGAGKTQLAVEFVYEYRARFPLHSVLWVHGSTHEQVYESFAAAARLCGLKLADHTQDGVIRTMATWLQNDSTERWLLVIDNAKDVDVIFGSHLRFVCGLIESCKGVVLITTNDQTMAERLMPCCNTIEVPKMTVYEATSVLTSFVGQRSCLGAMHAFCAELGHLPLAIVQAAAYMKEEELSLAQYMHLWRISVSEAQQVLTPECKTPGRRFLENPEIPNAFERTMLLALDCLARRRKRAAAILRIAAFVDHRQIPLRLLLEPDEDLRSKSFVDAIGDLNALCLCDLRITDESIDMHNLAHLTIM